MAYIQNSLGYRYPDLKRDEKLKLVDVHRETNYFYGRMFHPKIISRLIEENLSSMRPVGLNPRLGEAVICQYIHGKEADMKWYRAQITNKYDSIYRVIFVDYGSAAEYHADVFHEHARVPTEELIRKKISCVPFKDKNDYSAKVGVKSILDEIIRNHRGSWRFLPSKEHVMERFDPSYVMSGRIFVKINGKNIRLPDLVKQKPLRSILTPKNMNSTMNDSKSKNLQVSFSEIATEECIAQNEREPSLLVMEETLNQSGFPLPTALDRRLYGYYPPQKRPPLVVNNPKRYNIGADGLFHCMKVEFDDADGGSGGGRLRLFGYMSDNEQALIELSNTLDDYIVCFGGFDHDEFDIQEGDSMIASVNLFPDTQSTPDFVRCRVLEMIQSTTQIEYRVHLVDYGFNVNVTRLWPDRSSHIGPNFEIFGMGLEYKHKITTHGYDEFVAFLEASNYKIFVRIEEKIQNLYKVCFADNIAPEPIEESDVDKVHQLTQELLTKKTQVPMMADNLVADLCLKLIDCIDIISQ